MAEPTIVFNATTGSDTAASGAPATMSPLTGTSASTTSGSSTINLSSDNPNLTNVPTDGTALIWINRTDGRNAWKIIGKDNVAKTVTVTPAPDVTGTFAWAIGGKRATFENANSRKILENQQGATIYTETDQTINSTLSIFFGYNQESWFGGINDGTRKVLTITVDQDCVRSSHPSAIGKFRNLVFRCTAATKTSGRAIQPGNIMVENCQVGTNASDSFFIGLENPFHVIDCAILYTANLGIKISAGAQTRLFRNVLIRGAGSHGIGYTAGSNMDSIFLNVLSVFNSGSGFNLLPSGFLTMNHCVAHGNSGSGVLLVSNGPGLRLMNCILSQNGAYGISSPSPWNPYTQYNDVIGYNCFWQNASGARNNFPVLEGDISVDPQFADAANLDFRVGANLKAKGWPKFDRKMGAEQTNTYSFVDIGAAQREEPAGGAARGWVIGA